MVPRKPSGMHHRAAMGTVFATSCTARQRQHRLGPCELQEKRKKQICTPHLLWIIGGWSPYRGPAVALIPNPTLCALGMLLPASRHQQTMMCPFAVTYWHADAPILAFRVQMTHASNRPKFTLSCCPPALDHAQDLGSQRCRQHSQHLDHLGVVHKPSPDLVPQDQHQHPDRLQEPCPSGNADHTCTPNTLS